MINKGIFFFLTQFSFLYQHQNQFRLDLVLLLLYPDMSRLNRICLMVVKRRDLFHCSVCVCIHTRACVHGACACVQLNVLFGVECVCISGYQLH